MAMRGLPGLKISRSQFNRDASDPVNCDYS
jgi:hypothetical protein